MYIKSEPLDEEMPPPRTISEDELSDDEQVLELRMRRRDEIDNALNPSPQKRGRQVGSGAGEKRKADHEYSENPNTKRARLRTTKMTDAEGELRRVKATIASAKSKARKKVRENTVGWANLALGTQEKMYKDAEDEVDRKHEERQYTVKHVRSKLENERLALDEEIARRDNAAVNAIYRKHGLLTQQDENSAQYEDLFWVDDDDDDDQEMDNDYDQEEYAANGQHNAWTNGGDIAGGYLAGFERWEERTLSLEEREAKRAERRIPVSTTIQQAQWDIFQTGILDRLKKLTIKEDQIRRLRGTPSGYAVLKSINRHTPNRFFSKQDKALLRFGMAMQADNPNREWIDLPGPAAWWPSVKGKPGKEEADKRANNWYLQKGFDVSMADMNGYRFARDAMRMKKHFPKDWIRNLVHIDGELIWDAYRE